MSFPVPFITTKQEGCAQKHKYSLVSNKIGIDKSSKRMKLDDIRKGYYYIMLNLIDFDKSVYRR